VRVEANRELALLKILDHPGPFPAAQPAAGLQAGQPVLAIGTPGNRPGSVTIGRVALPVLEKSFRYGDFGFERAIELRLDIEPGHSGGPVFDSDGLLVGMIVGFDLREMDSGEYTNTGTAYALPAADLMRFFHRWRQAGRNN